MLFLIALSANVWSDFPRMVGVTDEPTLLYKKGSYCLFLQEGSLSFRGFQDLQHFRAPNIFALSIPSKHERERKKKNRNVNLGRNTNHDLFVLPIASAPIFPGRS